MPFCPKCGTEYRSGVERCSDCSTELVDSLLPEEPRPDATLVVLATFPNAAEARLVLELLEQNGIEAVLRGDLDPIGNVVTAVAPALLVQKPDLAAAQEIYEAFFAGEGSGSELADEGNASESPEKAEG